MQKILMCRRSVFDFFYGLGLILSLTLLGVVTAHAIDIVDRSSVTIGWAPAAGPVAGYAVYVNRNGLGFASLPEGVTAAGATAITLRGEPGDSLRVRVAAFTSENQLGGFSPESDSLHFIVSDALAAYDLDGDGKSEAAWLELATGAVVVSPVTGNTVQPVWLPESMLGQGWSLAGSGDFDGDGAADLLLRNARASTNLIWRMAGDEVVASLTLESVGSSYRLQAIGDFNADGRDDLLWRNARGGVFEVWLLDGNRILARQSLPSATKGWSFAVVADFDGDGKIDLVWRNKRLGTAEIWFMDGTSVARSALLPLQSKAWLLQSAADFDGDARPDLLWQNAKGFQEVWLMNGADVRNKLVLPTVNRQQWKFVRAGDFDGDGCMDLLWYSPSTQATAIWKMGATGLVRVSTLAGAPGKGWLAAK